MARSSYDGFTGRYTIRAAHPIDLPYLPLIETSAATAFSPYPELAFIERDESMTVAKHGAFLSKWCEETGGDGGTWIAVRQGSATEPEEIIVAFIVASLERSTSPTDTKDQGTFVHIHELGVHSEHQRKGLASRLMATVRTSAQSIQSNGVIGLSLTTIRDLPFNGVFYGKQGFHEVPPQELEDNVGTWAVQIWNDDQNRFETIKNRRCFMVCWL